MGIRKRSKESAFFFEIAICQCGSSEDLRKHSRTEEIKCKVCVDELNEIEEREEDEEQERQETEYEKRGCSFAEYKNFVIA